jgi:cation diffusion facilitator CzcD-associated flavoprotein CzcO
LLDEWEWSEHFSPQPETLRYVNHVADKFDLRRNIEFEASVERAEFSDARNSWTVTLASGAQARAQLLITAIGVLSTPAMPAIDGIAEFSGEWYHTGLWPHEPVDFSNKRVAVIGTGATGVQVIQEVAKTAGTLTVFQRTPNYCAPLKNRPITPEEQVEIKASYDDIFARCRASHGQFIHNADPRYAMRICEQEREAFYEQRYAEPGFGIWMGNFRDTYVDEEANRTISDFIRRKIAQRIDDPVTAERLSPRDHGFGTRRVPLETNYYEVYNQANVELVDVREAPIQRITRDGVQTSANSYEFDIIIYATGFDAVTGAFDNIDIRGLDGVALNDAWHDGPRTYLGLQTAGFPNLFTLVGPHNAATFCNIPRCIEQNVEWVTDFVAYIREHGIARVNAEVAAQDAWMAHVIEANDKLLLNKTDSWFTGINRNLAHKQTRKVLLYSGGAPAYRERCEEVAANGYAGFELS